MTPTAIVRAAEHGIDAAAALGRLRRTWPWLSDARAPGRPGTHVFTERRMSPEQERIENAMVRRDRRAKHLALREGKVPPGPHPVPIRLGAVRARVRVAGQIRAVAADLAALPTGLADPGVARRTLRCAWCAGTGITPAPPATWYHGGWPSPAPACWLCGGWGALCATCGALGGCTCDLADVIVIACLDRIGAAVTALNDPGRSAAVASALDVAADTVCAALGLADVDLRVIKAPCPACDRRDLWADVASPRRQEWTVLCRSPLCRCKGPACGCGRPVRWRGRLHRWPAAEFNFLADRLGVRLP